MKRSYDSMAAQRRGEGLERHTTYYAKHNHFNSRTFGEADFTDDVGRLYRLAQTDDQTAPSTMLKAKKPRRDEPVDDPLVYGGPSKASLKLHYKLPRGVSTMMAAAARQGAHPLQLYPLFDQEEEKIDEETGLRAGIPIKIDSQSLAGPTQRSGWIIARGLDRDVCRARAAKRKQTKV
jgi:hypothetical protein